jgi:hypothetical protein
MDLKDFISKTICDVVKGLDDSSKLTGKNVGLYSTSKNNQRHIEFDIAVSVETKNGKKDSAGGGIRVLEFLQAGLKTEKATQAINSTASRIKFGVRIRE